MEFEQRFKASGSTGYCTVENGIIYEISPILGGQRSRIGVVDAVYNELKNISDEYYRKLVELGAIVPPKTPEEIQQETVEMMSGMLAEIKSLRAEMERMKDERKDTSEYVRNESAEHAAAGAGVGTGNAGSAGRKQFSGRKKSN